MTNISILTPARQRPQNIRRMLESIKATQSGNHNIEVIFRIDETDNLLNNKDFMLDIYQMIDLRLYIQFIVGPETFPDLGCLWNECYEIAHGNIFQMGGDDLVYETKDWDEKIVQAFNKFPDRIALVWAEDGNFANKLATHGFVDKKWIDILGWFTPPLGLTYANDDFIHNIALRLDRICFLGDVKIRHAWDGSNPNDPNYGRMGQYFDISHTKRLGPDGVKLTSDAVNKLRTITQ